MIARRRKKPPRLYPRLDSRGTHFRYHLALPSPLPSLYLPTRSPYHTPYHTHTHTHTQPLFGSPSPHPRCRAARPHQPPPLSAPAACASSPLPPSAHSQSRPDRRGLRLYAQFASTPDGSAAKMTLALLLIGMTLGGLCQPDSPAPRYCLGASRRQR